MAVAILRFNSAMSGSLSGKPGGSTFRWRSAQPTTACRIASPIWRVQGVHVQIESREVSRIEDRSCRVFGVFSRMVEELDRLPRNWTKNADRGVRCIEIWSWFRSSLARANRRQELHDTPPGSPRNNRTFQSKIDRIAGPNLDWPALALDQSRACARLIPGK